MSFATNWRITSLYCDNHTIPEKKNGSSKIEEVDVRNLQLQMQKVCSSFKKKEEEDHLFFELNCWFRIDSKTDDSVKNVCLTHASNHYFSFRVFKKDTNGRPYISRLPNDAVFVPREEFHCLTDLPFDVEDIDWNLDTQKEDANYMNYVRLAKGCLSFLFRDPALSNPPSKVLLPNMQRMYDLGLGNDAMFPTFSRRNRESIFKSISNSAKQTCLLVFQVNPSRNAFLPKKESWWRTSVNLIRFLLDFSYQEYAMKQIDPSYCSKGRHVQHWFLKESGGTDARKEMVLKQVMKRILFPFVWQEKNTVLSSIEAFEHLRVVEIPVGSEIVIQLFSDNSESVESLQQQQTKRGDDQVQFVF